ncbi:MAG: LptA/OstA family protein [Elusimicrobiota bacterium]|jgi:lipopolysaccharide transport protein LptA
MKQDVRFFLGFLGVAACLSAGGPLRAVEPALEATITSDELQMQDNGAQTIFTGNVVLIQSPYRLEADRMQRTKATGLVQARGHVRGTWISDSGEKIVATGQHARYDPNEEISELWGEPEVTRWETPRDTCPVVLNAERIIAQQRQKTILAQQNVRIRQGTRLLTRSEQGQYSQTDKTIHLWGKKGVFIHVKDTRGSADFTSNRGWVLLDPKEARLIDNVRGHVIPNPDL